MNTFLSEENYQKLHIMSQLITTKYENSKGTKVSGKLFLLGENELMLTKCVLRQAVNKNYYIVLTFTCKPRNVYWLKGDVVFAPHHEFVFDYERAKVICNAFGHDLKPQPDDMELNAYMTAVARRIRTFVGRVVQTTVYYEKELRTDDYGEKAQRIIYYDKSEDIKDFRVRLSFNKPDWKFICDNVV